METNCNSNNLISSNVVDESNNDNSSNAVSNVDENDIEHMNGEAPIAADAPDTSYTSTDAREDIQDMLSTLDGIAAEVPDDLGSLIQEFSRRDILGTELQDSSLNITTEAERERVSYLDLFTSFNRVSDENTKLMKTIVEKDSAYKVIENQMNILKMQNIQHMDKLKDMEKMLQIEMDQSDKIQAFGANERKELNEKIKGYEEDILKQRMEIFDLKQRNRETDRNEPVLIVDPISESLLTSFMNNLRDGLTDDSAENKDDGSMNELKNQQESMKKKDEVINQLEIKTAELNKELEVARSNNAAQSKDTAIEFEKEIQGLKEKLILQSNVIKDKNLLIVQLEQDLAAQDLAAQTKDAAQTIDNSNTITEFKKEIERLKEKLILQSNVENNRNLLVVKLEQELKCARERTRVVENNLGDYFDENVKLGNEIKLYRQGETNVVKKNSVDKCCANDEVASLKNELTEFKKTVLQELSEIKKNKAPAVTNMSIQNPNPTTSETSTALRFHVNAEEKEESSTAVSSDDDDPRHPPTPNTKRRRRKKKAKKMSIVPGHTTYSKAVSADKKNVIISASLTRDIDETEFNHSSEGVKTEFVRFRGKTINNIKHYMTAHLDQVDSVMLLAGGNDLPSSEVRKSPVANVVGNLIEAGKKCKHLGVKTVAIGSILPRTHFHYQLYRKETNDLLRKECTKNGFKFIDNNNIILAEHIQRDGVHLNSAGTEILRENFLSYVNNDLS